MPNRPFFTDPNQHADGPPRRFGTHPPAPGRPSRQLSHFQKKPNAPAAGTLPALQSLLTVLVVALFLITFTVQPIRIPSDSMEPTLLVGDFLLLNKQAVAPSAGGRQNDAGGLLPPTGIARGDIIVFHDPVDDASIHLVKRVIGIPGDRIYLRNGAVFRNGRPLTEPYAIHNPAPADNFRDDFPSLAEMDPQVNPAWWATLRSLARTGEITVPPDQYFVLGDNRNDSQDSRYWGFVPRDAIVGKPLLVYFSWKEPAENTGRFQNQPGNQGPTDFARWDRTFQVVH